MRALVGVACARVAWAWVHQWVVVRLQDYSDEVIFGWYAHQDCWAKPEQPPHCLPESGTGITTQRAERVLNKFVPK